MASGACIAGGGHAWLGSMHGGHACVAHPPADTTSMEYGE